MHNPTENLNIYNTQIEQSYPNVEKQSKYSSVCLFFWADTEKLSASLSLVGLTLVSTDIGHRDLKHTVLPKNITWQMTSAAILHFQFTKHGNTYAANISMYLIWDGLFCLRLMQVVEINTACSETLKEVSLGSPLPFCLFPVCLDAMPYHTVGL